MPGKCVRDILRFESFAPSSVDRRRFRRLVLYKVLSTLDASHSRTTSHLIPPTPTSRSTASRRELPVPVSGFLSVDWSRFYPDSGLRNVQTRPENARRSRFNETIPPCSSTRPRHTHTQNHAHAPLHQPPRTTEAKSISGSALRPQMAPGPHLANLASCRPGCRLLVAYSMPSSSSGTRPPL